MWGGSGDQFILECQKCTRRLTSLSFTRKQRRKPAQERTCIECVGHAGGDPGYLEDDGFGNEFASGETIAKATGKGARPKRRRNATNPLYEGTIRGPKHEYRSRFLLEAQRKALQVINVELGRAALLL